MTPTPAPTLRAAALIRMSTDMQAASPERQRTIFREYCSRYGLVPVGEYEDLGVSATHVSLEHRTGLQRLLADAAQRHFDLVWCEELSRIARRGWEFSYVRDTLRRQGIPIVTAQDDPRLARDTAVQELLQDIMAGVARFEVRQLGDRVRRAQRVRMASGQWKGGIPPLGLRWRKDTGWEIVPEQAALVRHVFETYLEAGSMSATAHALLQEGVRGRRGALMNLCTVRTILRNPVYRGVLTFNGEEFAVPGIPETLPASLVAAVDARLAIADGRPLRATSPFVDALFAGLLRCPECGRWLSVHVTRHNNPAGVRSYYGYLCWHAHRTDSHLCTWRRRLSERKLEAVIVPALSAALRAAASTAEPSHRPKAAERTAARQLEALDQERERLIALHLRGMIGEAEVDAQLARLAERRRYLEELAATHGVRQQKQASRSELRRVLRQLEEEWSDWPRPQQRSLLQALVAYVVPDADDLAGSALVLR